MGVDGTVLGRLSKTEVDRDKGASETPPCAS